MTPTPSQAIAYYQNLLIIQYNGLPKASATIAALSNCNICDGFFFELAQAFVLGTATGQQLAIIGRIVGVPSTIYGLDLTDTFMTFTNWSGQPASVGYNSWTTPTDPDKWASWLTTAVYTPTTFEMTALIRLKIIKNNCYCSLGQVIPALFNIFGNAITLTDNFNTSISYTFQNPYHNVGIICSFLGNICPKPMGQAINFSNI